MPGFGQVKLAVRPESIALGPVGGGNTGIRGTVEWRSYVGPAIEYLVRRGDQSIFAVVPVGALQFIPGDEVTLLIDPVGVAVLPE